MVATFFEPSSATTAIIRANRRPHQPRSERRHASSPRQRRLVEMFLSYENVRDAWIFSCPHWQHFFGRPSCVNERSAPGLHARDDLLKAWQLSK